MVCSAESFDEVDKEGVCAVSSVFLTYLEGGSNNKESVERPASALVAKLFFDAIIAA